MSRATCRIVLIGGLSAAALSIGLANGAGTGGPISFDGGFETGRLIPGKWYTGQLREALIQERVVRSGRWALRLRGAVEFSCRQDHGNCLRNQIRPARAHHLPIGAPAWYGMSLRVEGEIPGRGSIRTVLAEWKEHGGASPFAALRFDNGVLHLTVQNNNCRRFVTAGAARASALVPSPVPGADQPPRRCGDQVVVEVSRLLPDPTGKWVDLAVFVHRHRHEGRVEIWANGQLAGRARGPIGNDLKTRCGADRSCREHGDARQYFKAGPYADICAAGRRFCRRGEMVLYVDNIRRGVNRAAVDPSMLDPR